MKNNAKNMIISLLFTLIIVFLAVLLIKNIGNLSKLICDNDLLISILFTQSKKELILPFPIIFSTFVIYFAIIFFTKKLKKYIFILLMVLFSIISLISILLFCKLGDDYVFELLEKVLAYLT